MNKYRIEYIFEENKYLLYMADNINTKREVLTLAEEGIYESIG